MLQGVGPGFPNSQSYGFGDKALDRLFERASRTIAEALKPTEPDPDPGRWPALEPAHRRASPLWAGVRPPGIVMRLVHVSGPAYGLSRRRTPVRANLLGNGPPPESADGPVESR
jgi:hypothetical protein